MRTAAGLHATGLPTHATGLPTNISILICLARCDQCINHLTRKRKITRKKAGTDNDVEAGALVDIRDNVNVRIL